MLREVKPRNARTARIVKAREPQMIESRKKILLLHGNKCPQPVNSMLKTIHALTKPESIMFRKKNDNIHPFEDTSSLEFLASKNDCGVVVFGAHSKKRPNNVTIVRMYDGRVLDLAEFLIVTAPEQDGKDTKLQVGVEMKPLILFAGSQWDDTSSSEQATQYQTMKSMLLDLFQGEEISSVDVAGLQFIMMIAAGEPSSLLGADDPANKPVLHLRWYKVQTSRSNSPKIPRVELDQVGPSYDLRLGRFREADSSIMRDAMKHGRKPNEARTKKNIETDLVGDKIGRVHLGRQNLDELQTRKMKGLKRSRDELEDVEMNGMGDEHEEDMISEDEDLENGGMDLDDGDDLSDGGSSGGGTGDEISIGDHDSDQDINAKNGLPKRQKLS